MTEATTRGRVITRAALKALAIAGAATSVVVAPNSAQLISMYLNHMKKNDARRTLYYMKYKRLIDVRIVNGHEEYRLTSAGKNRYKRLLLDELQVPTPARWDHKWRMVIFDIPKAKQMQRDLFLSHLKQLHFYMLQRSVWIHPFDSIEQIGILLHELDIEHEVSYMVVEQGNFIQYAEEYYKKQGILI